MMKFLWVRSYSTTQKLRISLHVCRIKKRCGRTELLHDTVKWGVHLLSIENFAPGTRGLVHKITVDWMAKATNIYFSWFWSLRSPRSRVVRFCVWWEPASWFTAIFSLRPHLEEETRQLCGVTFLWTRIPFMRALHSWPNYLPKAPTSYNNRICLE